MNKFSKGIAIALVAVISAAGISGCDNQYQSGDDIKIGELESQVRSLESEAAKYRSQIQDYQDEIRKLEDEIRDLEEKAESPISFSSDADKTVYISNNGIMHKINDCSGMKNYFVLSYLEALEDGYTLCDNCGDLPFGTLCGGSHEASDYPDSATIVFTENTRIYHIDQDCGKYNPDQNDGVMSDEDAIACGYSPCSACCG